VFLRNCAKLPKLNQIFNIFSESIAMNCSCWLLKISRLNSNTMHPYHAFSVAENYFLIRTKPSSCCSLCWCCHREFSNNSNTSECSYSTNAITLEELGVVEEIARNLGLYVTPRRQQASYTSFSQYSNYSHWSLIIGIFFQFFTAWK